MKKFLLIGICVLLAGCCAYAFDAGNGTELNIRPKADIIAEPDMNILPIAEPTEVKEVVPTTSADEQITKKTEEVIPAVQPEEKTVLPEDIDVKLPEEDLKSIEEIQSEEEETVSEEPAEEQFKEDDFEPSEEDIELEIPVREKIKTVQPEQKKQTESIMAIPERKNYTVIPYSNNTGTIYRF